eukprot:gene821-1027_t
MESDNGGDTDLKSNNIPSSPTTTSTSSTSTATTTTHIFENTPQQQGSLKHLDNTSVTADTNTLFTTTATNTLNNHDRTTVESENKNNNNNSDNNNGTYSMIDTPTKFVFSTRRHQIKLKQQQQQQHHHDIDQQPQQQQHQNNKSKEKQKHQIIKNFNLRPRAKIIGNFFDDEEDVEEDEEEEEEESYSVRHRRQQNNSRNRSYREQHNNRRQQQNNTVQPRFTQRQQKLFQIQQEQEQLHQQQQQQLEQLQKQRLRQRQQQQQQQQQSLKRKLYVSDHTEEQQQNKPLLRNRTVLTDFNLKEMEIGLNSLRKKKKKVDNTQQQQQQQQEQHQSNTIENNNNDNTLENSSTTTTTTTTTSTLDSPISPSVITRQQSKINKNTTMSPESSSTVNTNSTTSFNKIPTRFNKRASSDTILEQNHQTHQNHHHHHQQHRSPNKKSSPSSKTTSTTTSPSHQNSSQTPTFKSTRLRIPTDRYDPRETYTNQPKSLSKPNLPSSSYRASWRYNRSREPNRIQFDSDSDDELGNSIRRGGSSGPLPININQQQQQSKDSEPVNVVDSQTTFKSVGGLDRHINLLKEMLMLPLLYPEIFNRFKIQPPKGVLFYGPPGTGKTLLARALVNECNIGGQKVSFFMRKGADCLSKWVGEAERQLRLLFEQAKSMQPSIIFFDEIDGLAPVRSSRQDQIHSSIVSTLLALMDGLDNRGQVIVIGATNRIDSIDPALRRPGRFDRELLFTLPSKDARKKILNIHTSAWVPPPEETLIDEIADLSTGYCGADIKSLCSESLLCSLRRNFPQIYQTANKLLVPVDSIQVEKSHFIEAMKLIIPSSKRSAVSYSNPLSPVIKPLLQNSLDSLLEKVDSIFPMSQLVRQQLQSSSLFPSNNSTSTTPTKIQNNNTIISNYSVYRPRLLISGDKGMGQIQLANSLLYHLEEFPIFPIDITTLVGDPTTKTIEESCIRILSEAKKASPCILYIPNIDQWLESSLANLSDLLFHFLSSLDSNQTILLVSTIEQLPTGFSPQILDLFKSNNNNFTIDSNVSKDSINKFYSNIFRDINETINNMNQKKNLINNKEKFKELPVVPFQTDQIKELKRERQLIRQLRILLREILTKIIYDKKYIAFFSDVNIHQFPEYYELIKNPTSLHAISKNLDNYEYLSVDQFLKDIELIVSNTELYYQVNDPNSIESVKAISRAKQLQDEVYLMVESIDPSLVVSCDNISKKYAKNPAALLSNNMLNNGNPQDPSKHNLTPSTSFTRSARLRGEQPVLTNEIAEQFFKRSRRNSSKKINPTSSTPNTTISHSPITSPLTNEHTDYLSPESTHFETNEQNHNQNENITSSSTTTTTTTTSSSSNNNHINHINENLQNHQEQPENLESNENDNINLNNNMIIDNNENRQMEINQKTDSLVKELTDRSQNLNIEQLLKIQSDISNIIHKVTESTLTSNSQLLLRLEIFERIELSINSFFQ